MSISRLPRRAVRVLKAGLTNVVAMAAPGRYFRWIGETGRGGGPESPSEVSGYFERSFDDYVRRLGGDPDQPGALLAGRTVLEYGPGDLPATGLLCYAHGAAKVYCVDRFPIATFSEFQHDVVGELIRALPKSSQDRALGAFATPGDTRSGLSPDKIEYLVKADGLSGLRGSVDFIVSRAVLEHVNDLGSTFRDMQQALRPGARAAHLVDLRSHGLHETNPLDFLCWPEALWNVMYSHKGVPNRHRLDHYRDTIAGCGLTIEDLDPLEVASEAVLSEIRPRLPAPIRDLSDEDLGVLTFWLVLRKDS